jgi:MFS family permease
MIGALGLHYAFGVFFKPLIEDFGWSRAVTSGAVSLSFIIQGASSILLGALNDRSGPRLVLSLSGFILGAGYILMSQVNSVWQIYLFYGVFVGAGLGGIFVPLNSTVARWFSKRRSAMTGIVVAGIGIGTLFAPLAANWLISLFDWRISYQILGAVVFVVVIAAAQFLKSAPAPGQMPLSEVSASETGISGLFFKEALRTFRFWMVFGLAVCFGTCLYVVLVHIVPFATDLGIPSTGAAGLLSAIGGTSIAGKVIFGRLGDKIGSRNVMIISFIIMLAAFLILLPARSIWVLYIFAIIFGLAYAGLAVTQSPVLAVLFGLRAHGALLGVVNFGFTAGAAIGPTMAGYIFDTTHSYRLAFIISAVISVFGLLFSLALKTARRP